MTDHDPLCPQKDMHVGLTDSALAYTTYRCECYLISRVREEYESQDCYTLGLAHGIQRGREDAARAVESIGFDGDPRSVMTVMQGHYIKRDDAITAAKGADA